MAFELTSSAFRSGDNIPSLYTCDGSNISPPLSWKDFPAGTKSFVIVMEDPDAPNGTWDHWVIYNLPNSVNSLPENLKVLPQGAVGGKNSWNKSNYGGPCPPDKEHRYFFKIYALDTTLPSNGAMAKQEVENAMKGHILASTELVGKYQRVK